jgi:hypothetical protein
MGVLKVHTHSDTAAAPKQLITDEDSMRRHFDSMCKLTRVTTVYHPTSIGAHFFLFYFVLLRSRRLVHAAAAGHVWFESAHPSPQFNQNNQRLYRDSEVWAAAALAAAGHSLR